MSLLVRLRNNAPRRSRPVFSWWRSWRWRKIRIGLLQRTPPWTPPRWAARGSLEEREGSMERAAGGRGGDKEQQGPVGARWGLVEEKEALSRTVSAFPLQGNNTLIKRVMISFRIDFYCNRNIVGHGPLKQSNIVAITRTDVLKTGILFPNVDAHQVMSVMSKIMDEQFDRHDAVEPF